MTERGADQRSFAILLLCAGAALIGLGALVMHLLRLDAPSHIYGLIRQLCTTAPHVTMDFGSMILGSIPIVVFVLMTATAFGIVRRTNKVLDEVRADRLPRLPAGARQASIEAGLRGRVEVVDCPDMLVFAYGFARPRVVVTTAALQSLTHDELVAVLCHEAHHVTRRDPLRMFVAQVAARGLAMLPLIGELRDHFTVASEIAADRRAIEKAGRSSLVRALLKFEDAPDLIGLPAINSERASEERLAHLIDPKRQTAAPRPSNASLLLSGLVVTLVMMLATLLSLLPAM
jgi:Zn-dependent protease with chaperone function